MSSSFAFATSEEEARPWFLYDPVVDVERELRIMNEEFEARMECHRDREAARRGILTDAWGVDIHEPLPGSPAYFANELAQTARNQSNETPDHHSHLPSSGNSLLLEEQDQEPDTNENPNEIDTEDGSSEDTSSEPPHNGPGNEDVDDFPPEMRAMRGMVQTMVRAAEAEKHAEDDATEQGEEDYEQPAVPDSIGGVYFEEGPGSRRTEPESAESVNSFAEAEPGEAVHPVQDTAQDAQEEIIEEDFKDEDFVKEEAGDEDEDANSGQNSTPNPRSRQHQASTARGPVLEGKKVQTKAPFKRVRANPRPTEPEWPEFLQQPLSAKATANPAGFRKAHDWIATKARDVPGLLSITKKTGLIKQNASGGLGDWKAGVITHFLNAWILHKHKEVLFKKGARDHAEQIKWYDSRSHAEQDEFRIWIMTRVEAALKVADRNMVQQLRTTQERIVKPLDRAIAAGTWRHPTLGVAVHTNVQNTHTAVQTSNGSGQGVSAMPAGTINAGLGAATGGNGTASGTARRSNGAVNPRQSRKRDREVEDDDYQDEDTQAELEAVRPRKKKLRATGGEMDRTSHGSRIRRNVPPPKRQHIVLQTIKREREDSDNQDFTTSSRPSKRSRRSAGSSIENSTGREGSGTAERRQGRASAGEDADNIQSARARGAPLGHKIQPRASGASGSRGREFLPASRPSYRPEPSMTDSYHFEDPQSVRGFDEPSPAAYSETKYSAYPDPEELGRNQEPYYQNDYGDQS